MARRKMARRTMYDGQVPCPRAGCQTTLSRIGDIPRHIKDIHEMDNKWYCPYLTCKYKGAQRRGNALTHIKDKHLMREPQSNAIGRIYPGPISERNRTSEANRDGASSMASSSSFQALTNSSLNNPPLHNAYTTSHAANPSTTEHPAMKYLVDYESSYPSPASYSTATLRVEPHPPMFYDSDHFSAEEDSKGNSTDVSGGTWSGRCSSAFDATVWDDGVALYHWDNFEPASSLAYTHDWNDDQK